MGARGCSRKRSLEPRFVPSSTTNEKTKQTAIDILLSYLQRDLSTHIEGELDTMTAHLLPVQNGNSEK